MIKILTELEKRGHHAQLILHGSEQSYWINMITRMGTDFNSIKMRLELGDEESMTKLFNSMLYSLLRNGYKLIEVK